MFGFVLSIAATDLANGQAVIDTSRAVGGIFIDADGAVQDATVDDLGKLSRLKAQALGQIPAGLDQAVPMRKVSLRRLGEAIERYNKSGKQLPDAIRYLAGLQQIQYVFVYPERRDIVLAGPGEGWKVDKRGYVVGQTTGRPVMLLDDLLVALRTARQVANGGISCSIDPTDEGVVRFRQYLSQFRTMGNPQVIAAGVEQALGPQQITVHGVPGSSHFARVLVAADYRMKRLGMNLDRSPVAGLPSFLSMVKSRGSGPQNMLPRWWLEPVYEPLLRSPDGLAWELRGAAVKVQTESDFVAAGGDRQQSGKADPAARKWADLMTKKYDELAVADPIFGQLRNCMELAVVAALIVKEHLPEKADYSMPVLLDSADVKVASLPAPKQVASTASLLKKGRRWIISASGGVQLNSWVIADRTQQSDAPAEVRVQATADEQTGWWWN
jgi:hypothetical protein